MVPPENLTDAEVVKALRRLADRIAAEGGEDAATMQEAREALGLVMVHGHRLAQALAWAIANRK